MKHRIECEAASQRYGGSQVASNSAMWLTPARRVAFQTQPHLRASRNPTPLSFRHSPAPRSDVHFIITALANLLLFVRNLNAQRYVGYQFDYRINRQPSRKSAASATSRLRSYRMWNWSMQYFATRQPNIKVMLHASSRYSYGKVKFLSPFGKACQNSVIILFSFFFFFFFTFSSLDS